MTSPDESRTSAATLKRAYLTIDRLQRALAERERAGSEPIAIIGIGCRFPGSVVDADTFWHLLSTGADAVGVVPADRWDVDAFYDERPNQPGKMVSRLGGFLDRIDLFDHEFFGISRREAVAMDPQQRLSLEVAWEALEDAGLSPAALAGSDTGVFAGVCTDDFALTHFQHPLDVTAYSSTGAAHSAVCGRISYALDLKGPAVAVDTACSSSLVAVHLACQSLRTGECDTALAGGVNVIMSPLTSVAYSQFPGMVSPDGICRTFDAAANGSIPSEGCGFVVLKRLSDAVRDGCRILAVVRGSAVNQDGRSAGLTAPSGLAQREVIRRALRAAGVRPEQVGYVETHGSGTPLGDPIEVEALAEVYGRGQGTPVYLGTAKTNIGHPQAAAGVAGLIKVVLALSRGAIPGNLHFQRLNPDICFDGTTFAVPTSLTEWPLPEGGRMAGVSGFGFSGTNAHVIVAEAPAVPAIAADTRRPVSVLALSARTPAALARLANRYAGALADPAAPLADLCFSANTGRAHFPHRLAAVGGTPEEIAGQLSDYVDGIPGDEPVTGVAGNADVVFLFTGQGSQRPGMAGELYRGQPTFRRIVEECERILRPVLPEPLTRAIYPADGDAGLLDQPLYAQPALFAVEYALAALWRSWGVEPVAVLGHSLGEYVAACVAGVMSLADALALVAERGRLMQGLTGTMAVVFAPEAEVAAAIADLPGPISVAAVNGPANTVVSGDRDLVAWVCARFAERGVKTKQMHVTNSGHSAMIEPALPRLRRAAGAVRFHAPRIPLVSNVDGELWPWDRAPDADYWCRHARQPVRFAAGVARLRAMGYRNFLEVGPAPTLLGLISDADTAQPGVPGADAHPGVPGAGARPGAPGGLLLPSLRPKQDDWSVLASTVARLYVHGAPIDWSGFDRDHDRRRVAVPTYPFEPTRCWQEPRHRVDGGPAEPAGVGPGTTGPGAAADEFEDADLLYRLEWQPAARAGTPAASGATTPTWLVLSDGAGIADRLAAVLAGRGQRCVRVTVGRRYRYAGGEAAVHVDDGPDDLARLLAELGPRACRDLRVVHLCGVSGDQDADTVDAQAAAQQHACLTAARLVQALATTGPDASARLWLVTRGAVAPTPDAAAGLSVSQATLWGLGRSLQQEHPGIWGGLIDLDPDHGPEPAAAELLDEIDSPDGEDQIALRAGVRYVARLARAPLAGDPPRDPVWRTDASYLVTGGLTGIGLAVAGAMVRAGARHLVLVGRTPLPPRDRWADLPADSPAGRRVRAVRDLEALGASVLVESRDVSDHAGMAEFLRRFDREGRPPIRGIVHSAGVVQVEPLLELTPAALRRQLLPKSVGAWVLHRVFAGRPLDFFVLFGSGSSILSSPFTAAYAAANAGLDALAQLRRAHGLPALCIGWGLWLGTGMAEPTGGAPAEREPAPDGPAVAGPAVAGRAAPSATDTAAIRGQMRLSSGMGTIDVAQGVRVFLRLLRQDLAQVTAVPIDWPAWGRRYRDASGSALLARLLDDTGAPVARGRGRQSLLPARAELTALPAAERHALLAERLHHSIAAALGARPADVAPAQPLVDLGFDSLMAVELRNELEGRLGVFVPVSAFLADASVRSLADHISGLLDAAPDGGGPGAAGPAIERVARAGEPSGDLAERLLAEIGALSDEQASLAVQGEEYR